MGVVLRDEGFRIAFVVATVGTVVVWWLTRRGGVVVGFALASVVAALVALRAEYTLSARLVIGLVLLGVVWLVHHRIAFVVQAVGVVAGAFLVIGELDGLPRWMQAAGFVAILVAVPLSMSLDRASPRWMPLLVLLTVGGIYECAPDTEISKVMLGAVVPVALLVLVPKLRPCVATASLAGLIVWVAVLEGRGRPGAVVGSIACLGVILVAPLVRWRATSFRAAVFLVATQAVLVLWVSRVAGLRESAWAALALCIPAFVVAWLVLALVNRRETS